MPEYDKEGRPLCDIEGCKNPAAFNIQSGYNTYSIDDKGEYYGGTFEVDDNVNDHLCEKHYEEEYHHA